MNTAPQLPAGWNPGSMPEQAWGHGSHPSHGQGHGQWGGPNPGYTPYPSGPVPPNHGNQGCPEPGHHLCPNPPIDENVIENNAGEPQAYVEKILKILQHDRRSLTGSQMVKFLEKTNYPENKMLAIKGAVPFLSNFNKQIMIELIKKAPYPREKVAVVEHFKAILPPGLSYQDRCDIADSLDYPNDKEQARKLLGL